MATTARTARVRLNLEVIEDRAVPATLSGTVVYDTTSSGAASGVEVVLTRSDATTVSATTDAAGAYAFTGLGSGSYAVQFNAPRRPATRCRRRPVGRRWS